MSAVYDYKLVALSLAGAPVATHVPTHATAPEPRTSDREPAAGEDRRVYEALSTDPAPLDDLARAARLDLGALCGALQRLARAGLARDVGGWWERA